MTAPQLLSVAVIALMMAVFVWGGFATTRRRLRPAARRGARGRSARGAFTGFSDDIVIIVGSALLVSAGSPARASWSRDPALRAEPAAGAGRSCSLLVVVVDVMSAFIKNIGALAIMIPIAFQFAGAPACPASIFLMPMAFASLLGGLMTLIGTSPNIVVSPRPRGADRRELRHVRFHPGRRGAGGGWARLPHLLLLAGAGSASARAVARRGARHRELLHRGEVAAGSAVVGKPLADLLEPRRRRGGGHLDPPRQEAAASRPSRRRPCGRATCSSIEGDHAALDRWSPAPGSAHRRPRGAEREAPVADRGRGRRDSSLIGWSAEASPLRPPRHQPARGQPPRRPPDRAAERGPAAARRRADVQGGPGRCPELLRDLGCCRSPSGRSCSAASGAGSCRSSSSSPRWPSTATGVAAGRGRLLCRGRGHGGLPRRPAARGLRGGRRADPGHARRADPGQRLAPPHRRQRRDRAAGSPRSARAARLRGAGADPGGGDGGHAVPQQRRHRAGHGADRRQLRRDARLPARRPS